MTVEEMRKAFARNLKKLMEDFNCNQEDIAKICGTSQQAVSEWLAGKKYPRMDKVQALLDHFNIPMTVLVNDGKTAPAYYTDPETMQIAAMLKDKPGLVRVARLGKDLSEDDLKQVAQYTEFLAAKNEGAKLNDVDDDL